MARLYRTLAALGSGGIMLGVLPALDMVSFANAITRALATFVSLLISLLLGGDPTRLDFLRGFAG